MKKLFSNKIYFILLLPLFFVFHGFTEYFPVIPVADALTLFLTYLTSSIIVTGLAYLLFRSWTRAAIVAFILIAFYFFFGPIHDFIKSVFPASFISSYTFLIPFSFVLVAGLVILIARRKYPFIKASLYLNILLVVLILIDAIFLLSKISASSKTKNRTEIVLNRCDSCLKPDIYLIVSDEYAGRESLSEDFGFDNSPFEMELKKRGFHIIDKSRSNYNSTPFSIASLLSMDYMPPLTTEKITTEDINKCTEIIKQAASIDLLKNHGYLIHNLSIFDLDGQQPLMETKFLPKKIRLISGQTFLSRLDRDIRFNLIVKYKWESEMWRIANKRLEGVENLYNETVDKVYDQEGPKFVYTHLLMPHYPYFFDSTGKKTSIETILQNTSGRREYISYLQYSNKKFLFLIDHILQKSARPPVILFVSDHGFRGLDTVQKREHHFMNISAVHLPSRDYRQFYEGMSNVNLMRGVFNTQFKQQMPRLKDSLIFLDE